MIELQNYLLFILIFIIVAKTIYNIHHHYGDGEQLKNLILSQTQKLDQIMATIQQFQAALDRIDAATTDIAADLQALKDQIAGAGLSSEVEAEVLAKLEAAAAKLEGIGGSVENPVPEEPAETPVEPTEPPVEENPLPENN